MSSSSSATNTTDYTAWTREALISRIRTLEAASPSAKLRKPAKPFSFANVPTRLIALKFAYLGAPYNGYEYSSSPTPLPTVEETLFLALLKARLVPALPSAPDPESIEAWPGDLTVAYSKCGRTDRGVSAFGQVIGVRVRANVDYTATLNRILPPTIRVLAWCPSVPESFSARFDCRSRTYRYLFTGAAVAGVELDVEAMQSAAGYFLGEHDFRNFCKLDASKQITNFVRRILVSRIVREAGRDGVWYFELQGTAFLWHQVRHMMAILFLVGQGLEKPEIVRDMLDLSKFPTKPAYEMASERALVLWECEFDSLEWVPATVKGKVGRDEVVDSVFEMWQKIRIDEVMLRGLRGVVEEGREETAVTVGGKHILVTGDGRVAVRGVYKSIETRDRNRAVEDVNREYLEKNGDYETRRERRRKRKLEAEGAMEGDTAAEMKPRPQ